MEYEVIELEQQTVLYGKCRICGEHKAEEGLDVCPGCDSLMFDATIEQLEEWS